MQILSCLRRFRPVFTFRSEVGGQTHLDLMFSLWKSAPGAGAAWLIVAITPALVRCGGPINRRALCLSSVLVAVVIAAGAATWRRHADEPQDDTVRMKEPGAPRGC